LADTDVLAITSKNEGTPVAVIEALAAGCMPVCFDVGGVRDVLMNGDFGRLVVTRSASAFASVLDEVLATPPSLDWRNAARQYSQKKYSLDRLVHDHVRLYCALLEGERSA
jgi:glycosyltransferase involved in cell wall biosynthesis